MNSVPERAQEDAIDAFKLFAHDESAEFDYYLQWQWPEHIDVTLRRLLWTSLVELAESSADAEGEKHSHTALLRWRIVTCPDCPSQILSMLASVPDKRLQERIAENPQTPAETLGSLACSEWKEVRMAVSEHPTTPVEALELLSRDADPDVRYIMAENAHLSRPLLEFLAQDDNGYVAARAQQTLLRRNPCAVKHLDGRQYRQSHLARKLG